MGLRSCAPVAIALLIPNFSPMKYTLLSAALFFLAACGSAPDSAELAKAREVHAQVIALSGTLHDGIAAEIAAVDSLRAASSATGDSTAILAWTLAAEALANLDTRFHDFSATVTGLPGEEHDHAHDHGEEGDHAHHHHAAPVEGLSDAEHLAIQEEFLAQLKAMEADLAEVQAARNR